jgi:hypothetical protein
MFVNFTKRFSKEETLMLNSMGFTLYEGEIA